MKLGDLIVDREAQGDQFAMIIKEYLDPLLGKRAFFDILWSNGKKERFAKGYILHYFEVIT